MLDGVYNIYPYKYHSNGSKIFYITHRITRTDNFNAFRLPKGGTHNTIQSSFVLINRNIHKSVVSGRETMHSVSGWQQVWQWHISFRAQRFSE